MLAYNYGKAFDVSGRVIVVTGAASGVGRALSLALVSLGATVAGLDVDKEKLSAVATEAGSTAFLSLPLDIRQRMEVEAAAGTVTERFGRIDGLVNCAAVVGRFPAIEFPEDEWDRQININLKGTFLCCQAFGRYMVKQHRGKVVNFASVAGIKAHPNSVAYQASKGGVIHMTRALAVEWAPYKINVNAIAPSIVMTPQQDYLRERDPKLFDLLVSRIPLGRATEPEELIPSVVLLLSAASDQITGHLLAVDGGYLA
jgi:NAD(P)-dependent dehydrogenase (short-subunit alcohol dehydrogenase family)